MINFKLKSQATFVFVLLAMSMIVFGDDNRRDGNWWLTLQKWDRINYTVGFLDGQDLGYHFSIWKYTTPNANKTEQAGVDQAHQSYLEYSQKFSSNVTAGQLVDGLDNFYSDYRNRRIRIYGAVWLVLNGIAGTPEDKLNKLIESWRKNSTD